MIYLTKNPLEREVFTIDVANRMVADETVSSAVVAILRQVEGGGWQDMTPQFRSGESSPTVSDSFVTFYLKARSNHDQPAAEYAIRVTAALSSTRVVVACDEEGNLPRLTVIEA